MLSFRESVADSLPGSMGLEQGIEDDQALAQGRSSRLLGPVGPEPTGRPCPTSPSFSV